jgi:hypothetical protein
MRERFPIELTVGDLSEQADAIRTIADARAMTDSAVMRRKKSRRIGFGSAI